jgi:hypothetical protein
MLGYFKQRRKSKFLSRVCFHTYWKLYQTTILFWISTFFVFFFSFVKSYELINFTSIKVIFSMFLYTKAFLYSITIKRESSAWTWPCIRIPLTLFSVGPGVLASSFWLRYLVSFYEFFENKLLMNIQWKYFFCSLDFWHGFIIFVNFFHSITHKILKRYVDISFQTLRLWYIYFF